MFNFMRWGIPLLFLCGLLPCLCADAIGQVAPYVKKMIPENGAEDVKSNLKEIVITFSEPMMDRSWSITGSGENFPEIKDIRYKKHCTVMIIKVELKPGWTYHFGLNSSTDRNFISQKGIPLNPVSVTFKTRGKGPSSESTVPYVIEMIPENGAKGVDPELKEMLITFSEPMKDKSWSLTGSGENYPEIKSMYYKKNCTVLVLKMDLKPSWTYRFGINSPSYKNFMSRNGIPVEPVQVTFSTKGEKVVIARKDLPSLGKAEFSFEDSNGMEIRSADYKGVPLFITFGAAW